MNDFRIEFLQPQKISLEVELEVSYQIKKFNGVVFFFEKQKLLSIISFLIQ